MLEQEAKSVRVAIFKCMNGLQPTTKDSKTYTVSQKLKGKIEPDTQEIVTIRPLKNQGQIRSYLCNANTCRAHQYPVEWVGKVSGIEDDVRASGCEK